MSCTLTSNAAYWKSDVPFGVKSNSEYKNGGVFVCYCGNQDENYTD